MISLLLGQKYQRAMWLLRELGFKEKAQVLENFILENIFTKERKKKVIDLGLGFTDTYRIFYEGHASLVFKPRINFWTNPVKSIISHYKREVAAYIVDGLLGFNSVPLTFLHHDRDEGEGSSQFFMRGAYQAVDMKDYDGEKPSKFSKPKGRIKKDSHMLLFDWLIDNRDRNVENYMILDTGKVVFIDHGMSFMKTSSLIRLSDQSLRQMMPTLSVFTQMQKIVDTPYIAFIRLKPYLSKKKIKVFINKVKLFVRTVEDERRKDENSLPFAKRKILY